MVFLSFLDLGACLGASTHWTLCMLAVSGIVLEAQESFCKRGAECFKRHKLSVAGRPWTKAKFGNIWSSVRISLTT